MFCSKCGSELKEGALFCSKCGAKVPATLDEFIEAVEGNNASNVKSEKPSKENKVKEKKVKEKKVKEPKEEKAKKESTSNHSFGKVMLSIITVIFLFVSLTLLCIRSVTSKANIEKFYNDVKYDKITLCNFDGHKKIKLYDYIGEISELYFINNYGINATLDEDFINDLFKASFFKKFFTDKTSLLINDFLYDTGEGSIDLSDIEKFITKNEDKINNLLYKHVLTGLSFIDIEGLAPFIDTYFDVSIDVNDIANEYPVVFSIIRICFKIWIPVLLILFSALFMFFVFRLENTKKKFMLNLGVVFTVTGSLISLYFVAVRILLPYFGKNILTSNQFYQTVGSVFGVVFLKYGLSVLITGILLIVIYNVIRTILAKKEQKNIITA